MERRDRNGFSVKRNNLKQLKESKKIQSMNGQMLVEQCIL